MASISVNPSNLSFGWRGGRQTSTVTSSTSWSLSFGGSGNEWCYASKSGTEVIIETEWNLGRSTRGTGINATIPGMAAAVGITQTSNPVSNYEMYSVLNKVSRYAQMWNKDCASACLCMCINQSPQSVYDKYPTDYFDPNYGATWNKLANIYGYECTPVTVVSGTIAERLAPIFSQLKSGYPVIVKVSDPDKPHWVVVVGYAASYSDNLYPSNFLCLDPDKLKTSTLAVPLNEATRYTGVYKYVVVSKM